jgi:hypothetical protein
MLSNSLDVKTVIYSTVTDNNKVPVHQDFIAAISPGSLQQIYIAVGTQVKISERTVFTLVDAVSVIGGFAGSVFFLIRVLFSWYGEFAFL